MAELIDHLPSDYEYVELIKSPDLVELRVKNVNNEEEANAWLEEYSELTLTTWRVQKTFPRTGRVNVFKKCYRCQFKTDGRHRKQQKRISKNTDCPARIEVVVRRYNPLSRAKKLDILTKDFPAAVTFRKNHNHAPSDLRLLKHRDMSNNTREKLISLFHAGHTASSARNYLKMELILNERDTYLEKLSDARYVPSISVVSHLYRAVMNNTSNQEALTVGRVTAREVKAMMGQSVTTNRPGRLRRRVRLADGAENHVSVLPTSINSDTAVPAEVVTGNQDTVETYSPSSMEGCQLDVPNTAPMSVVAYSRCNSVIDEFAARVKQGLTNSPQRFIPAVEAIHRSMSTFAASESGLLATLYAMGYCGNTSASVLQ